MEGLIPPKIPAQSNSSFRSQLKRFYLSLYVQVLYAFLLLLAIFAAIWVIIKDSFHSNHHVDEIWFVIIEFSICFAVIIDLALHIYITGVKDYFKSTLNLADFLISLLSVTEIVLAFMDILLIDKSPVFGLGGIILRTIFMILRMFLIIKRSLTLRKSKVPLSEGPKFDEVRSMDSIRENNIEYLKVAYRARLDTLREEDEQLEASYKNNDSVWKGRIKDIDII